MYINICIFALKNLRKTFLKEPQYTLEMVKRNKNLERVGHLLQKKDVNLHYVSCVLPVFSH